MHEPDEWDNIHECQYKLHCHQYRRICKKDPTMQCLRKHCQRPFFYFLDLRKINLALREEEAKLYIIMFSNESPPFIVSVTY